MDWRKVAMFSRYSSFRSVRSTSAISCRNVWPLATSSEVATPRVTPPTVKVTSSPSLKSNPPSSSVKPCRPDDVEYSTPSTAPSISFEERVRSSAATVLSANWNCSTSVTVSSPSRPSSVSCTVKDPSLFFTIL